MGGFFGTTLAIDGDIDRAVDRIQARYGWTDAEVIALPIDRFRSVVAVVAAAHEQDERQRLIDGAFVGWQILAALGADVGTFNAYLSRLGLT